MTTTTAEAVARIVVERGGWVRRYHAEDFIPAYERFLASLTEVVFVTWAEAEASVARALRCSDYFELFGIPSAAEEYFPSDDEDFEECPYLNLVESMTTGLARHGVIHISEQTL
jgi:hypothetical protein